MNFTKVVSPVLVAACIASVGGAAHAAVPLAQHIAFRGSRPGT
jgi:hypothetical protein